VLYIYLAMLEAPEDKEKMAELYVIYREYLCNIAQSILHSKEDAEDVLHTAFVRVANNFTKIGEVSCHQTRNYLVLIVIGLAKNLLKKRGRHGEMPLDDLEGAEIALAVEDVQLEQIEYEALIQAMENLPQPHRHVLYLMYYEGQSVKEIGKALDLSESAVKKRLERARQALRKMLKEGSWEA